MQTLSAASDGRSPNRSAVRLPRMPARARRRVALPSRFEEIERVAIRFAGDSGDGMQLTGTKFTESTALAGNDLSTLPDFPAEIRAPAGTLAGVSGFQIHFSPPPTSARPPTSPTCWWPFNPAALRANIDDVRPGGMVIVNSDAFTDKSLHRAGYDRGPAARAARALPAGRDPVHALNREALKDLGLSARDGRPLRRTSSRWA